MTNAFLFQKDRTWLPINEVHYTKENDIIGPFSCSRTQIETENKRQSEKTSLNVIVEGKGLRF